MNYNDSILIEILALSNGSFYAPTKEIWKVKHANLTTGNWRQLYRNQDGLDFQTKSISNDAELGNWYNDTRKHAEDSQVDIVAASSSRSSPNTHQRDLIWKEDIAGNSVDIYKEGAHLLPAGTNDHEEWFNIAAAVVGIRTNSSMENKLKALRGAKPQEKKNRFKHEGVVHFVTNRTYLQFQKQSIDGEEPGMLIVPIMSVEGVQSWKGKGYKAIVLAGLPHEETPQLYKINEPKCYANAGFKTAHSKNIAKIEDVRTACDLLKTSVLAMAEMVRALRDEDLEPLNDNAKKNLKTNRDRIGDTVLVPDLVDESATKLGKGIRVYKACFTDHDSNEGHPAPDPLLLAHKAANVWGRMTGLKFLANGEIPDPFSSEKHIMAVERYLDWHQSRLKNVSREELARGLGQLVN